MFVSILAGILGRAGGAGRPYRSWYRDWIIPLIFGGVMIWLTKKSFNVGAVVAYILGFLALGGSLSTYWDKLFKEDNLWFSGFICGLTAMFYILIGLNSISIFVRAILLALIWGCLNKFLPSAGVAGNKRILFWRRDIIEEFLRYVSVIATAPILLIGS